MDTFTKWELGATHHTTYQSITTDQTALMNQLLPSTFDAAIHQQFTGWHCHSFYGDEVYFVIDGGVAQTVNQSFDFNGESDLDLEYAMVLTNPQPVLLLQTGDLVEGAGFDNWLDAVDKEFCTFEGVWCHNISIFMCMCADAGNVLMYCRWR